MAKSPRHPLFQVFVPFSAGYLVASVFRSINSVIGPDVARDLGASATDLGLLTSVFFLAAIFAQLPVGLALDRFGSRRVGAALLFATAIGGAVFALASDIWMLMLGRALIGIGVTTGMAVAFKAFSLHFHSDRLPVLNGLALAAGGIGLMAGTWPVEMALSVTDWRGVVWLVSAMAGLMGFTLFVLVPEHASGAAKETLKKQLAGLKTVLQSRDYWQIAPLMAVAMGGYAGFQTLWAGPWLRDVAGMDRPETAATLLIATATTVLAMPIGGYIATRLDRSGIPVMSFVIVCAVGFELILIALCFQGPAVAKPAWMLFGFLGPMPLTAYAAIGKRFPKGLTGRVNASLTLLWMAGAFAVQTGIGAVLDIFPPAANGGYAPGGYQIALGVLIVLLGAALCWYGIAGAIWRSNPKPAMVCVG